MDKRLVHRHHPSGPLARTAYRRSVSEAIRAHLQIDGFQQLSTLPPPADGQRRLRNREIALFHERRSLTANNGNAVNPFYYLRHHSPLRSPPSRARVIPIKTICNLPVIAIGRSESSASPAQTVSRASDLNEKEVITVGKFESVQTPVKRGRGRPPRLEMRVIAEPQPEPTMDVATVAESMSELSFSGALVAHSSNPILTSSQSNAKKLMVSAQDKVIPSLRQPRPLLFQRPPPDIFDDLSLFRHYATTAGLVAQPVVPSHSSTQQFLIRRQPSASPANHCMFHLDAAIDSCGSWHDSASIDREPSGTCTLPTAPEGRHAAPCTASSKQFMKSIVVPPEITIVMKNSTAPRPSTSKATAQQTPKHEIMITPIRTAFSAPILGRPPKSQHAYPYLLSAHQSQSPAPLRFSSCLVVQCLPNTPVSMPHRKTGAQQPRPSSHPRVATHKVLNSAKVFQQKSPIGITKIVKELAKPVRSSKHQVQQKSIDRTWANSLQLRPEETHPRNGQHAAVRLKDKSAKAAPNPSSKSTVALPFLSDQISYFPVTSSSTVDQPCRDCQTNARTMSKFHKPNVLLETNICADCCEQNHATSQYFDHNSVSLIPIYDNANQVVTIDDSDTDSTDSEVYYIPKPTVSPLRMSVATQCQYDEIRTAHTSSQGAQRKAPSIECHRSPDPAQPEAALNALCPNSKRSPEQTVAFQRLQHVLNQQLPFSAARSAGNRPPNQSPRSDCGKMVTVSPNASKKPTRHTTSITMVSKSMTTSTGTIHHYQRSTVVDLIATQTALARSTISSPSPCSPPAVLFGPDSSSRSSQSSPTNFDDYLLPTILTTRHCSQDSWPVVADQAMLLEERFQDIMEFIDEEAQREAEAKLPEIYAEDYGSAMYCNDPTTGNGLELMGARRPDAFLPEPTYTKSTVNPNPKPTTPIQTKRKTPTPPVVPTMSAYARTLLAREKAAAERSSQRTAVPKKTTKPQLEHPATGDAFLPAAHQPDATHAKRKGKRCPSPTLAAVAKRPNQYNEIDIIMRLEATEFTLDDLDNIPMDQLFVPTGEFNISDYL